MDTTPRPAPLGLTLPAYGYDVAADLLAVHDGDTLKVRVTHEKASGGGPIDKAGPLSYREWEAETYSIRLAGVAAPELSTPAGVKVTGALALFFAEHPGPLRVRMLKGDKYNGRESGIVWRSDGVNVAQWLRIQGYAVPWDGKGKQPVPAGLEANAQAIP